MTCDIRDRNLPCKAAAYQLVSKLGRGRVAKAAQSGIDVGDIKTLSDAISSILDVFHLENGIVVERQVDQIAQNLTEHRQEWRADKELQQYKERKDTIAAALKERYVPQAVYDAQLNSGCMDNTRVRILNEIDTWIKDPDSQQVCWITGMAGCGKTSLAKTVCERASVDADIVLGGTFFCSRSSGLAAQRDIRCVVPTLAQLLALESVEFCQALAEKIQSGVQYKEVAAQVEQLLYAPLLVLGSRHLPILFVIDALDECGGESSDGMLDDGKSHTVVSNMLEALIGLTRSDPRLPIKFLVTSRPEVQVRDTSISDENFSHILRLHAVDAEEIDADIRRYITETFATKLSGKRKLRAMISDSDVEDLVRLCDGLFIVAATALEHTFGTGVDAALGKFKRLLNTSRDNFSAGAAASLDGMYALILMDAVKEEEAEETGLPVLLRLLASLLSARMTLSIAALGDLLVLETYDVRASFSRLHAVIHVPEDDDMPGLRTVHASFGDYLFSRASDHIRIPRSLGHKTLAHACLDLMRLHLCFNISQSASSYELNPSARPDNITLTLEYACLHWAHHVAVCNQSNEAASNIPAFDVLMNQKFRPKFLFWLEVLSVLNKVGLASGLLRTASSAVKDPVLLQFLLHASAFVVSSQQAVERSAPHIYLSALPFVDKTSLIYQDFAPHCKGLITVNTFGIGQHSASAVMTLTSPDGPLSSIAYSPDGQLLASGSQAGTIRIWDTLTGEEALSPLRSGDGRVLSVDFASNNKCIASGNESGAVCIWNVTSGPASHRSLAGHSQWVNSVAFSPDGSRIASASNDKTVRLWNSETGEQLRVMNGHTNIVYGVRFSPDGQILTSISQDWTIRLWYSTTGQVAREPLEGSANYNVDFSPDGETIAGASFDKVTLWRYQTGEKIAELPAQSVIHSIRFSPDGRSLVAAHGNEVRVWTSLLNPSMVSSVDLRGHSKDVRSAIFSPNSLYIASASDDATIRIWRAASGQSDIQPLPAHGSWIQSVATSRDGSFIVSGSSDSSIRVWNARTGEESLPSLRGHLAPVMSVAISPDGYLAASASMDMTVRLWNTQSGVAVGEPIHGHAKDVNAVTFSHDGRWLATASEDMIVHIWDVSTRQIIHAVPFRCQGGAHAVAFSPDGGIVAAGDDRGFVYLWWTDTGEMIDEPRKLNTWIHSLAFSPDGTRIVSSGDDNVARISDATTGQPILILQGHTGSVLSVTWSFDGCLIGTGSADHTVRLWDAMTGAMLATLYGHTSLVGALVFAFDGQTIVSGSWDTTIRKWDVVAACKPASKRLGDLVTELAHVGLNGQWLVGASGELLTWVPLEYCGYLQVAPCTLLIGSSRIAIGVGDEGLYAGSEWAACWTD